VSNRATRDPAFREDGGGKALLSRVGECRALMRAADGRVCDDWSSRSRVAIRSMHSAAHLPAEPLLAVRDPRFYRHVSEDERCLSRLISA
jgi:hypothetical protein